MNCGPMTDSGALTEDAFLGGQLRLRQPKSGHRAGHDAMLLAAATPARAGDRVVDFGAGVGAAGLAVARRIPGIGLVLVEIDAGLADLARGNAAANRLLADIVVLDVTSISFSTKVLKPVAFTVRTYLRGSRLFNIKMPLGPETVSRTMPVAGSLASSFAPGTAALLEFTMVPVSVPLVD